MKLADLVFNGWRSLRTPMLDVKPQGLKMLVQEKPLDTLRTYIGWVRRTWDLGQIEISIAETVLNPQAGCDKVSNLAQSAPATNHHCC